MGRIAVLPSALADQIAAGEVIERPASVVRELLDNALDAGARRVVVATDGSGVERICVTDDGEGMPPDDAVMAFRRHATSKLRSAEELFALTTLGFRGEALPSIASVARVCLTTRTRDAEAGTRVDVRGGGAPVAMPVGCAVGTTVEVRDLFYNVPARRKFLRSSGTENAHVLDVVLRTALARPDLHLELRREGRAARVFLPARGLEDRARSVLDEGELVSIGGVREGVEVEALLAAPARARTGASSLHLFVNGRPVRDRQLARAVAFAYGSALPPGRFPVGVVHLTLDPAEVDVNVHPQKAEVRLGRAREVTDALTRVLAAGLGTAPFGRTPPRAPAYWSERLPPGPTTVRRQTSPPHAALTPPHAPVPPSRVESDDAPRPYPTPRHQPIVSTGVAERLQPHTPVHPEERTRDGNPVVAGGVPRETTGSGRAKTGPSDRPGDEDRGAEAAPLGRVDAPAARAPGRLRYLAQLRDTFLLCEGSGGLVIVDRHTADARVRAASLRRALEATRPTASSRRLLFPERVELTAAEVARLTEVTPELERLGFDVGLLGPSTVAVRAVPEPLVRVCPKALLRDVVDALKAAGRGNRAQALDDAIVAMARRAAVRAGEDMTATEGAALLDALAAAGEVLGQGGEGTWSIAFDEIERRTRG